MKALRRLIRRNPNGLSLIEKRKLQSWTLLFITGSILGACGSNGFQSSSKEIRPIEAQPEPAPVSAPQKQAANQETTTPIKQTPVTPTEPEQTITAELDTEGAEDSSWVTLDDQRESFLDAILASIVAEGTKESTPKPPTQPRCTTETTSQKQLLDIVFNIDVSTSMNPVIDAVKANVSQFAQALALQSRDVRIASVGFVDQPVLSIGFTDPDTFRTKVAKWNTLDLGNRSFQEGGQESLEHALWMFGEYGRPGASYVLVHISDAIIFAPGDQTDFSTENLGLLFGKLKNQFHELAFFDSVPSSPGRVGPNQAIELSPRDQITSLRSHAGGLLGESLAFPFNADSLTTELPNLINKTITKEVCEAR